MLIKKQLTILQVCILQLIIVLAVITITPGIIYDPYMYSSSNVYVDIEILIYSLKDDKLVWYGESTSINPESIEQTISELAVAVKNQLITDGLLDSTQ